MKRQTFIAHCCKNEKKNKSKGFSGVELRLREGGGVFTVKMLFSKPRKFVQCFASL